jgi:hypothetical protein
MYPPRSLHNFYTINKINSSSTYSTLRRWHGVDIRESGSIMRWRGHARLQRDPSLSPFSAASTTDMTKVHTQILRWTPFPVSEWRGCPCYCLIEIAVSSKKPRPLNSFPRIFARCRPGPPVSLLARVSTSNQHRKLNACWCILLLLLLLFELHNTSDTLTTHAHLSLWIHTRKPYS